MAEKILVTGGAGFIGSQLVRDLLNQKYLVNVIDDMSTGRPANLAEISSHPNLKIIEGSILNKDLLAKAVQNCNGVLHMAVSNLRESIQNPVHSHDVNATGTLHTLEAARKAGVKRFIYMSSSEAFGSAVYAPMDEEHPKNPCTVYASSKLAGEYYTLNYASMYGMNTTVIRPFNNFGPRAHFDRHSGELIPRSVVRLLNGLPPIIFGTGAQTRDFIHVSDTSDALIRAYKADDISGEVFNVGYGEEQKISDVAYKLCELLNPALRPDFRAVDRPGDVKRHYCDSKRFREKFGWKPKINFDEGLASYVAWFKTNYTQVDQLMSEVADINW